MVLEAIRAFITSRPVLIGWSFLVILSVLIASWDLRSNNAELGSLMKYVWFLTVVYSGPFGLAVYWYSGRKQISTDSVWRRGFRSVAHCYSGCGAGEATGLIIAVGLLAITSVPVIAAITFLFAYTFGYALTVGPLMQEGVPFKEALVDAFYSETASIVVMEIVAITADITLSGGAKITDPLFWTSLSVSLSLGLLAAYPVNVLLIHFGVKEGMMDPRTAGS